MFLNMKIVSVGLILHTKTDLATNNSMEIERKWVIDTDVGKEYAKAAYSTCHIVQHYVSLDENGNETRIRSKDGKSFTLTIKGKSSSNGLIRVEKEFDITADAFAALSAIADNRTVAKKRYLLKGISKFDIELDVYTGKHSGLTIAEVEFPTEDASKTFIVPAWFGREVTSDKTYKNQSLALRKLE